MIIKLIFKIRKWLRFYRFRSVILSQLIKKRICEPEIALIKFLVDNKIAIDIGANRGLYIFKISQYLDKEKIYAFEPNPFIYAEIKRFFPDVHIYNTAISDTCGEKLLKIPYINGKRIHAFSTLETFQEINETDKVFIKVKATTLDKFIVKHKLDNIGFIKIDVEGHEMKVLDGAKKTISKYKPNLLIEIEQRHHSYSIHKVFDKLKKWGYEGFYLDMYVPGLKRIIDFDLHMNQDTSNIFTNKYINNFIFIYKNHKIISKLLNFH